MLYAVKGNKQLKIDEKEKQAYLNLGYDIAKEVGGKLEVVASAPNKTVSYAEYEKLQKENEALRDQLESKDGNSDLQAKLDAAEKKVKELDKKLKEAEKAAEKAFDPVIETAVKK